MATGACRWLGVTMTTASMPSGRAASAARHRAIVGIAAVGRDADLGGRGGGVVGIGRQRAGDQRDAVVEPHRQAVHGADEGVAAAADHADPQPPSARAVRCRVDHPASASRPSSFMLVGAVGAGGGEVVECLVGDGNYVGRDERRALAPPLLPAA